MEAKDSIDTVIDKSRVHLYKPIQIAEILYRNRTEGDLSPGDLESYRTTSRHWRDTVTQRLVGNVSTSSSRYQDNLFDDNAVPPNHIKELDKINQDKNGIVENYIYHKCQERWQLLIDIYEYIEVSGPEEFDLRSLVNMFRDEPGLTRSLDKVYESVVHALFCTITRELNAQVKIKLESPDDQIVSDFSDFTSIVLGLPEGETEVSSMAKLYRVGVSNAADKGVDIRTNFGPIVQVKHVSLDESMAEDVVDNVAARNVVIVCKTGEEEIISSVLEQMPFSDSIQGIVTLNDLERWYDLCLNKYPERMGDRIIDDLQREINREFPQVTETENFMDERGYSTEDLEPPWVINKNQTLESF